MKAWQIHQFTDLNTGDNPLQLNEVAIPAISETEVLLSVLCCGVCHTEIDEIEGRTPPPHFPMTPGHQVVGMIEKCGPKVKNLKIGDRVGVAWIYSACETCDQCRRGLENLCQSFKATGRDEHGGYAEYIKVEEDFCYPIPYNLKSEEAAPLLCAGAIGFRSLRLTNLKNGQTLGLTGFGASGHLVLMMVKHMFPETKVMVFARSTEELLFARKLGAYWAGHSTETPPDYCHAIIDTTPAWQPVIDALAFLHAGGRLVINAIRKESKDVNYLMKIDYAQHLWMEKEIKSVANITRKDVIEFLELAARIPIHPSVELYPFKQANKALIDLKNKHVNGAKVLVVSL